ncbi:MAG: hypothetical protein JXQ30_12520 [Spirochaetes bacterium]|nr:hypothetical protein [Spirochaetota bacterium]
MISLKIHQASLFCISAALLSFEIALMRVLKIEGFGNFTYTAIALALLGFGASGTLYSIWGKHAAGKTAETSLLSAAGFILFLGTASFLSMYIAFDPLRLIWDLSEGVRLLLRYLLYTIPFLLGSMFVLIAFSTGTPGTTYFLNLIGSGAGVGTMLFCLFFIEPGRILSVPLFFALLSLLFIVCGGGVRRRVVLYSCVAAACGLFLFQRSDIRMLSYKGISLALNVPGASVTEKIYSPFGTLEIVESEHIRFAPGLSLAYDGELPPQAGLFLDGDRLASIDRTYDPGLLRYLTCQPQYAAYRLHEAPKVLIAGVGGGAGINRALLGGAGSIVACEQNTSLIKLLRNRAGEHVQRLLARPNVHVEAFQVREAARRHDIAWDIIEISEPDSAVASVGGIYSTDSSYTLTVDAMEELLQALDENGTVAVTIWLRHPPRRIFRLVALASAALTRGGANAEERLLVIRSWTTATLLMKKRPFAGCEIETIRRFAESLRFDLVYYPGMKESESNRYNIAEDNAYYEGTRRLLKDPGGFIKTYPFAISPPTDERPYFDHFFRIAYLPRFLKEMGKKWLPVVEGGDIVLTSTLCISVILSTCLIVLPLLLSGTRIGGKKTRILCYFAVIALAYMFIEVSVIERFKRYLSNPIYANSTTLLALLFFSGLGSLSTARIQDPRRLQPSRLQRAGVLGIGVCFSLFIFFSDRVFTSVSSSHFLLKPLIAVCIVGPLGFFMGMPFPIAISILKGAGLQSGGREAGTLAWAWSINGYLSVTASTAAPLVASMAGIGFLGLSALFLYLVSCFCLPKEAHEKTIRAG